MSTTTAPNAIFRMVSLRGPDADRFIDPPTQDGVVLDVLRDFDVQSLPTDTGRNAVREALSRIDELSEAQLARDYSSWSSLLAKLRAQPQVDLAEETIQVGGERLGLVEAGRSNRFRQLYSSLYHSWLAKALNRALFGRPDASGLATHTDLIRVAHVTAAAARGTTPRNLRQIIGDAPVVFPGWWRRPLPKPPRSPGNGSRRSPLLERMRADRASYDRLVGEIETIEALEVGASALIAEMRAAGDSDRTPLTDTHMRTIIARSPGASGPTASTITSRLTGLTIGDVSAVLEHDKGKNVRDANNLCSSIRVFEEQIVQKLPAPRPVQAGERPSVRSIGWGDLIVAQEELIAYEAKEIAHIENVLPGETKERSHERTLSIEELVEDESIEETVSERDLETSDRFELSYRSAETVDTDFSIEAGVNTSGRYGLTKVDTSVDAEFQQSNHSATENAVKTAKEVVSKTVERIQERVRELRRVTTVETIRELSKHSIDNTTVGTGGSAGELGPISGIYYWVSKIQEIELRHYGKRLMVEFYIPEPGITLIEKRDGVDVDVRKPAPFKLGPGDISVGNYMCLTKLYGAQGVKAPPAWQKQVGISFATNVKNSSDAKDAESTVEGKIKIPPGYKPYYGMYSMAGRGTTNSQNTDVFNGHIAVAGKEVLNANQEADGQKAAYAGSFSLSWASPTDDLGIPVTGRFSGHDDSTGTLNIEVWCQRSDELFQQWQIETYEKLKQAYDALVAEYQQAVERATFEQEGVLAQIGRPAQVNRGIERDELKKWSVKAMRVDHFDFDAIVGIGEEEDLRQEIDAAAADEQAPIVRFFESAFEWVHMSYFLYPYFWGRRGSWGVRQGITVPSDPLHEKFLQAGFARVVVPVIPGFEARVLQYLSSDPNAPELERIPPEEDVSAEPPASAETLWEELRSDRDAEVARGNGLLAVQSGASQVSIVGDVWKIEDIDLGRELFIKGNQYEIVAIDSQANSFELDRPYVGPDGQPVRFLVGSVPYGQPWRVEIPTRLVVLGENRQQLG